LLEKYEHLERISLLQQAVWKASCEMSPDKPVNDAIYWKNWLNKDWKQKKTDTRNSFAISVIIPLVIPSLR